MRSATEFFAARHAHGIPRSPLGSRIQIPGIELENTATGCHRSLTVSRSPGPPYLKMMSSVIAYRSLLLSVEHRGVRKRMSGQLSSTGSVSPTQMVSRSSS